MAIAKHVHKLKKHKYKTGIAVFFCTLADCHYKVEVPLALGKESLCNLCGQPFIMNEYTLKLTKPHCSNCGKREVKGPDGKRRYIRKTGGKILAAVAEEEASDLRSRLDGLVSTEEDI